MTKVDVVVGETTYKMNSVTYSGTERTIFDWGSDYISEFRREYVEAVEEFVDSSNIRLRVNKYGDLVYPPIAPEEPDTSKWKRMTPKRQGILAQYRSDKAQYDKEMSEWLQLPFLDGGRTRDEHIKGLVVSLRTHQFDYGIGLRTYYDYLNGTFEPRIAVFQFPCGRWHKGFGGNYRRELPYHLVEHHQMEVVEFEEGDWLTLDNYDPVWRRENQEVLRKWKKQHRKDFIRNQPDSTVQTTLTNNCWNAREVISSILFTFEGEDTELARKYLESLMDYGRPVMNGRYRIPDIYINGTPQEIEELGIRAMMVRG